MSSTSTTGPGVLGTNPDIHHIALSVHDLAGTARWYQTMLGFTERMRIDHPPGGEGEDGFMIMLQAGGILLELIRIEDSAPNPQAFVSFYDSGNRRGYVHGSFKVPDAHASMRGLAEMGVRVQKHVPASFFRNENGQATGNKLAWFWDPEGNLFQLFSGETIHGRGTWHLPSDS